MLREAEVFTLSGEGVHFDRNMQHEGYVENASLSPDEHHLVIASKTAKIWGPVDGQWQEKATIKHDMWVYNARFSPNGHYLMTVSCNDTAKI